MAAAGGKNIFTGGGIGALSGTMRGRVGSGRARGDVSDGDAFWADGRTPPAPPFQGRENGGGGGFAAPSRVHVD